MKHRSREIVIAAAFLACSAAEGLAQSAGDIRVSRPDRWFIASANDELTNAETSRMLYFGRDGTVLIVQCASRDGRKTGGWSFMVRREDWSFPSEFLEGWWSVDSEPPNGPLRWGGAGPIVLLNEDPLKARLQEPVESQIRFRVTRGTREWELEVGVRDLDRAVEHFAPSCEVA